MSDRIFRWNNFEYELLMCLFKFKEAFNFDDMLNANESILCIAHIFLTEEKDTFDVALMQHKADSFFYIKRDFYNDVYLTLNRINKQYGPYAHFGYRILRSDLYPNKAVKKMKSDAKKCQKQA